MSTSLCLNIAGTRVEFTSAAPFCWSFSGRQGETRRLYHNFICSRAGRPDIRIRVRVADKLNPVPAGVRSVFVTTHARNGEEHWRLLRRGQTRIYLSRVPNAIQQISVNSAYDRADAVVQSVPGFGSLWCVPQLIRYFLQVLLLHYFARRGSALLVHASAVADRDGRGFLFAGESGSGKTTTARFWQAHSRADVLNDDRVIVRRVAAGRFFLHPTPWYGDFSDYLNARQRTAPLSAAMFLRHAPAHSASLLGPGEAFARLYPHLLVPFWERKSLVNVSALAEETVRSTRCFRFGFSKDASVIKYVRRL